MRRLFSIGYFACWVVAGALLVYVSGVLLWGSLGESLRAGIDDDVTLLALPLGAVLGGWAAARARRAFLLHRALGVCGVLIAVAGAVKAAGFFQASGQASGTGPFSGLGELFAAGLSAGAAVFGLCLFGIWACARLARF